jgi:class 3 adenylate cyclase/tetratricopeptide (TPR) repeat protein
VDCPRCRYPAAADADFCTECGARLVARCAGCGTANVAGAKFCKKCGRPVGGVTPVRPVEYTPPHLVEKILGSRDAVEGERKQVTVLFADLKGSLELLADRDPEDARRILDPVLDAMMAAVHRYEGTVNQVLGDGIMALFGAPLAHEDHAVRACYAALRMHEAVRRYADEVRRTYGIEVQIRVGINSGEVVVRSIGNDLHMDYTAVGQTTHLAARMEQLATPGTTRLTAETLALVEGYVGVKPLGPVPVKGLLAPVEVYELTGAGPVRTRLQAAAARGLTRFIGREAELEQLRQAAAQARRGRGQVVAVVGEPGVGKSRLFYEFVRSHHTQGWLVLESASVSYGKATAFLPLIDLLKGYFKIGDRDDVRAVRSKVTGTMLTLDEALKESVPAVLWLLEALPSDHGFLGFDPAQRRQRALQAVKRLLLRESGVQPVLVLFEDLHWIDAETQAFLDGLVDSLPTAPILLAVNYRPEYEHGWSGRTYYRQLRIDPLTPETAEGLLATLVGEDPSVASLRRVLIARTDGNPLFLEESVRALVETGVLVGERGAYRLARPTAATEIPASVHAILAARIDRLAPRDKRLLQAASVVGKDVPLALLQAIAGMPEDDLRRGLAELQRGEFLYEARLFPDVEYTFNHALTHEVAYGSVLGDRRRALHAAIVDTLERLYADRLGEQVELLAHHAVRGDLRDKAMRYLREAGAKAVARSANQEAVALLQQALALLESLPSTPARLSDELDTRIALGPALVALVGASAPDVERLYLRAQEIVGHIQDSHRQFPVLWNLWFVHYSRGRYPEAEEVGRRLLDAARNGADSGRLLEAHHSLWATFTAKGQPRDAMRHIEEGIALYDRRRHAAQALLYGGHDPGVCCRYQGALNTWLLGHPDRALAMVQDARRLAEELRHPYTTTLAWWFTAWLHHHRGERQSAAAAAEHVLALTTEWGFLPWRDVTVVLLPSSCGARLDAGALAEVHRQLVAARSANWRHVFCLCVLAELYAEAGRPAEGARVLASIPDADRRAFYAPEVHRLEGELLLRCEPSRTDAGERALRHAVEVARSRGERSLELRATTSLARLLQSTGRHDEARRTLGAVYGSFTEGFETADVRTARALLAELA